MTESGRRPLKVRGTKWSQSVAAWLSNKDVTPNQISLASIGFAALAALTLVVQRFAEPLWLYPLLTALFIQCRLLCNLFDGMVAIEGGKSSPSGELFNDIPDRIADPLILVAAGYAAGTEAGVFLGWCVGLLAVMTAYVRTLASSIGAPVDFQGPMAKQHRMAALTVTCCLTAALQFFGMVIDIYTWVLAAVLAGLIFTLHRRIRSAHNALEGSANA